MHMYQVPWGLVAFLAYYVVLYEDPQSGELKISQALPYDQSSPTIVMVMYYVIRQNFIALQSVASAAPGSDPTDAPIDASTALLGRKSPPLRPNPSPSLTKRRTSSRLKDPIAGSSIGKSQASRQLGTSATSAANAVSWESLRMGEAIASGCTGTVFKASF
eukprot:TRINITY_DN4215_c0_g3_i1.p1 TRINITY_DN4215_c0_g3~~TRINITY_DN4215_c0_g3_i1.p1  ORF type:complete len:161 (-),score=7.48 TRINITY_DN4215_c0_g3_i1:249-731(-)